MLVYILLLGAITLLFLIDSIITDGFPHMYNQRIERALFAIMILIMIFLQTFRATTVGGDLQDNYLRHYSEFGNFSLEELAEYNGGHEIGYVMLNKTVFSLSSGNINALLFVIAALYLSSVARIIIKYSDNVFLSLLVFVSLGLFNVSMNNLRSSVALAVVLFALPALINGKNLRFLVALAVAALFHRTILVFLVFWVSTLISSKKRLFTYYASLSVMALFLFPLFEITVNGVFSNYASYFDLAYSGSGYRYLFFLIALVVFCLLYADQSIYERGQNNSNIYFFKMGCAATCLQLVSLTVSYFVRAVNYHLYAFVILLPNALSSKASRISNIPIVALVIGVLWLLYVFVILQGNGTRTVPFVFDFSVFA